MLDYTTNSSSINIREYRRAIEKWQSRETGNIGHTRQRKTNKKHNTICIGHHYTQANTNCVNQANPTSESYVNPTSELPPYLEAKDCKVDGVLEVNKLEHGICRI
jgi:hypothetical protein